MDRARERGRVLLQHLRPSSTLSSLGNVDSSIPFVWEVHRRSIEKILAALDQQHLFIAHHPPQKSQSQAQAQTLLPFGRAVSPLPHQSQSQSQAQAQAYTQPSSSSDDDERPPSPPPPPPTRLVHPQTQISHLPEPILQHHQLSAIRIQASYRGHMARRNIKGLTRLMRLQGVVRGQNVKRQTVDAMKQMQLLVRIQTQIRSQRIQMLENQAPKQQDGSDKQPETLLGNNLLWKGTSAQNSLMDIRTGGYPWGWNWLERQLPNSHTPQPSKNHHHQLAATLSSTPTPDLKHRHKQLEHLKIRTTPMSSRSMAPSTPSNRMMKDSKKSRGEGSPYSMKYDDSLMSCWPFSAVPSYMKPTVSAKAKARPTTSGSPSTPRSELSKGRFSFPFIASSKRWK